MRSLRVATGARRFRPYIGKLPGNRRLPGGARPQEQVIGFTACFGAAVAAAMFLPYNTLAVIGVGIAVGVAVAAGLSFMPYDGVPVFNKALRLAALAINQKPVVVAGDDARRQESANPGAFISTNPASSNGTAA